MRFPEDVSGNFLISGMSLLGVNFGILMMSQEISSFSLEIRFREDVSAKMLTFIKKCLMSQLICSIAMLMAPRVS